MNKELKIFSILSAGFVTAYFLPTDSLRFQGAVLEALKLVRWYAQEHILLCLVPAFFIAGAVAVFISRESVMKYFGPLASKWLSYSVASVSGTILAVCSCTVLPLFGSIYLRGAGLGPAVAFLYSGPAINVLAIVLTASVLGWPLGVARAVGAIFFSIVIGLLMHLIFRNEQQNRTAKALDEYISDEETTERPLWQIALYFFSMIGILVFANWARPQEAAGVWFAIFRVKWIVTTLFALLLGVCLRLFFNVRLAYITLAALPPLVLAWVFPSHPTAAFTAGAAGLVILTFYGGKELKEWKDQTWSFTKQILPLLFMGVLAAGFFLGSPESTDAGMIPNRWIQSLLGDSPATLLSMLGTAETDSVGWLYVIWPVWTNFFASVTGAFMYFATLTEVPILRGLLDSGMGQGPALALLLAGPALSLPNMLVINSILGPKKTLTFVSLVVVMATFTGSIYGWIMATG